MKHYRIFWHAHGLLKPGWSRPYAGLPLNQFLSVSDALDYVTDMGSWPFTLVEYPSWNAHEVDGRVLGYWKPGEGWRDWPQQPSMSEIVETTT